MQKFVLGCFFTVFSIALATTTSVTSIKAETTTEYLDNTTPQVIEKISGNIITFKNAMGESHNYFVPSWMIEQYSLKVGTSANLYNRNIVQGIYRDRYIDVASLSLPENMSAFTIHETERNCTIPQSPASEGLTSGKRVWYKTDSCPSAIPIVGSMSFYQTKTASSEQSDRSATFPSTTPETTNQQTPDSSLIR
ncbi:MAG: hypothetical protein DCF19_20030 [Pseudanabaena frigida]|uniref:Uncharacterized protein n=1 Tax=Pseudanabaena frigida TaxID=945775 RepID=A0A2W4XQV3_9CYAN|nr:MAG: hypothetical protein DCF19_20030 [Pseudanabaena frigida]